MVYPPEGPKPPRSKKELEARLAARARTRAGDARAGGERAR